MHYDPRDYEICIRYSAVEGDQCFIARVVDWPSITAHGETREDAAREIKFALEAALEIARESGLAVPAPSLAHA